MFCLCSQQIAALAKLSLNLKLGIPAPPNLPGLSLGIGALVNLKLGLPALPPLPPLPPLTASLAASANLAPMLAFGGAANAIKLGLGVDVTLPSAALQLGMLAKSAELHLPSLPKIDIKPILPAFEMALLVQSAKFGLGIKLLAPGVKLSLPALPSLPAANVSALLQLAATVQMAKLAFGIDLLLPGGVAKLQAMLSLMAKLAVPALALDMGAVSNLITLSAALATIKAALGIDLALPGAALKLAAALKPLLSLQLPSAPALPSLAILAKFDLKALVALKLSLPPLALPNLGPFALLASLTASLKAGLGVSLLVPKCAICTIL